MFRKLTARLLSLWLLVIPLGVTAQDAIFSQYFTQKMNLNPAMTGFEGGTSLNMNFRSQWPGVDGWANGYETEVISLETDMPCQQSALGLSYLRTQAGASQYTLNHFSVGYAWHTRNLDPKGLGGEFRLGLKASGSFLQLDWDDLLFSDQYDATMPNIVLPTALPIFGQDQSQWYMDLDFGMAYSYNFKLIGKSPTRRLTTGLSFHHLVRANPTLYFGPDTLPVRTRLHFSYVHGASYGAQMMYFVPMLKIDLQKATNGPMQGGTWFQAWTAGVGFNIKKKGKGGVGLWGGFWHQSNRFVGDPEDTNALSFAGGLRYPISGKRGADNSIRVGISYDYTYSGLRSNSLGVVELSLSFRFSEMSIVTCKTTNIDRICELY
ncbi:PorP/SprF family type IX secretion system membrane protein [Pontibacter sp. G13]|uniref:PorP/SprF family type IX secretion system membrane protein n=1 Tax=Pontibacter sp. G13 TaxID=3074898 RepID=UPI00288B4F67|nr:PorP/SprF family type IX secretion system membrane protein [Pontibacter sp. G13]WNJ16680.1 PorP/SprF family type IX secretion system membrane protein [Pontibacter sp. G13]